MKYSFSAKGHQNITSKHKTTLEFTKDQELTLKGDCIIGVDSDFDLKELKKFLGLQKIRITLSAGNESETIEAKPNPKFNSNHEMVIRKTDFESERTFAIQSNKAASDLPPSLTKLLKTPNSAIKISVEDSAIYNI